MTIHDKLTDRLYDYLQNCWECSNGALKDAARAIDEGRFDDLLGVREPKLDDVTREAVRVHGFGVAVWVDDEKCVKVDTGPLVWRAPTIASAYSALRALPDWKGEG